MLSAKQVQPGATGQIEAVVKTEGAVGRIEKHITVRSNDPRQPELNLAVIAVVEPEFTLSDRTIYFGSVAKGKEVVKEVVISIPPDKSVKVVSAQSSDKNVVVKLEPVSGSNGKTFKVIATQKADADEGYHFGVLNVKTTSTYTPEINIPVRGMVLKPTGN